MRRTSIVLAVALVFAFGAAPAMAAVPGNDDIGSPIVIEAIPYTNVQDTTDATTGPTDPDCAGNGPTVWYAYTAEDDGWLAADTFGSDYDTTLLVGTPDGEGGVDVIDCNDDWFDLQSRVVFEATEGATYLFMVGAFASGPGGELVFNLDASEPPPAPLDVSVTVDARGRFNRDGSATLSGNASCSGEGYLELFVQVTQRVGRFTIIGYGGTFMECSAEDAPWQLQVEGITGEFAGGPATVQFAAFACTEDNCGYVEGQQNVRLRNR